MEDPARKAVPDEADPQPRHSARLGQQLLDPGDALDEVLVAQGVRQAQVARRAEGLARTTATSASSRISAASSTASCGRLPRISLPRGP